MVQRKRFIGYFDGGHSLLRRGSGEESEPTFRFQGVLIEGLSC
jgi:hypothetical protein